MSILLNIPAASLVTKTESEKIWAMRNKPAKRQQPPFNFCHFKNPKQGGVTAAALKCDWLQECSSHILRKKTPCVNSYGDFAFSRILWLAWHQKSQGITKIACGGFLSPTPLCIFCTYLPSWPGPEILETGSQGLHRGVTLEMKDKRENDVTPGTKRCYYILIMR